jgi:hypothetical protein
MNIIQYFYLKGGSWDTGIKEEEKERRGQRENEDIKII